MGDLMIASTSTSPMASSSGALESVSVTRAAVHQSPLLLSSNSSSPSSSCSGGGGPSSSSPVIIPHPQKHNNNNNNNGQQMSCIGDDRSSQNNSNHNAASSQSTTGGLLQHSRNHSHPLLFCGFAAGGANNNNCVESAPSPEMAMANNSPSSTAGVVPTLPSSSTTTTMDILNLDFVNGNSSYSSTPAHHNHPSPMSCWPHRSKVEQSPRSDQHQNHRDPVNLNVNNINNSSCSTSATTGGDLSSSCSSSSAKVVVPLEIPDSVMKYLLTKSDSVDSTKSNQSSCGNTPASSGGASSSSSSEHNKRLQEILVDLDTLQSTSEIAKVLENFNAILERIEQEDDKEALEGLEALTTPLSPSVLQCPTAQVSSTSRIRNSVETLADLLLSGCGDEEDEDLLIIIDENDSESLQSGAPCHQLQILQRQPNNVIINNQVETGSQEDDEMDDDVSSLVEIEQDSGDLDQEEGYESDRPIVRASMRKLRPVKLIPMPSSSNYHHQQQHFHHRNNNTNNNAFSTPPPTPVTPRAGSPVDSNVGVGVGLATTLNSPIANKIIVTSLMNNLSLSPQNNPGGSTKLDNSQRLASNCSAEASSSSFVPMPTLDVLHVTSGSSSSGQSHSRSQSNSSQIIQFHQNPVTITTNPAGFVEVNIGNGSSGAGNSSQSGAAAQSRSQNQPGSSATVGTSTTTDSVSECGIIPRNNNVTTNTSPTTSPAAGGSTSTTTTPAQGGAAGSTSNSANGATGARAASATTNTTTSSSNNNTGSTSRPRPRAPQAPSTTSTSASRSTAGVHRNPSGRWPHRLSSVLAVIGCTLGLNNICRFSLLSVQYGANFILQFMFLSIVFGIPLLTFHMSIGQYLSSGIIDMWKISPIFQGIGVGLVISQAMIGIYTTVGVSWIFIYFRDSFITRADQYRWGKCVREFRDCEPISGYDNFTAPAHMFNETVPDYFNAVVLQRASPNYPDSAYVPSSLKFTVAFNLAVVWMVVFVSLSKGLKSYGKVVHGFVLAPVAALFVLAFKMVGLVQAGGSLFGQTKWTSFFFASQTWVAAAREAFFTWGLLGACVMQITAHNRHSHSLKSDSMIVITVTLIVLMLSAFIGNACFSILTAPNSILEQTTFSYVPSSFESNATYRFLEITNPDEAVTDMYDHHHISFLMGVRVIKQGSDFHQRSGYQVLRLATELFPATMAVLAQTGISSFWTVLFYFAFVLFGIAQQIAIWHCVIKGIIAIKAKTLRSWETTITFFVCGLGFVLGLPLCTETGIFIEYFMDYAIGSGWWIMVLYLLELIAVFIVRGAPYCGENIVTVLITGRNRISAILAPLISFIWNVIMPVAILVLSIASFKNGNIRELYDWNPKHGYRFWHIWTREVGSLIQLVPILAVPFVAILQSCRYLSTGPPDLFDRMQQLYRPNSQGLFGNPLSGSFNDNGSTGTSSSRNGSSSRGPEDPPPKYTPPPSYSTATGAKIAKFLRNSFRRSIRRLSSPSGPSTSSASPDSLPPPPNYASVILEINSQRTHHNHHQSSSCAHQSSAGASSLMNPIMVPPPSYDESTMSGGPSGSAKSSSNGINKGGESNKLYQIQLSNTLGRSLAEGSKERASLRRIASDITSRDIARMLRASLRRTTRDSPEASTSSGVGFDASGNHQHQVTTPISASAYSTNSSPAARGGGVIVTIPASSSLVADGSACEYTFGPNSMEKVEYDLEMLTDLSLTQSDIQLPSSSSSCGIDTRQSNSTAPSAFGFNFSFNRARNRNSNDSQLALITSGVYEDLTVTSGGLMGALVDGAIEIDQFTQLNLPRRDSLSQLNVLDLGGQGSGNANVNPTFQIIHNANASATSSPHNNNTHSQHHQGVVERAAAAAADSEA